MKHRALRFGTSVLGLAVAVFSTRVGRAEDAPDKAEKARTLFREGRALAQDGKYDAACPKFEESLKLDAGIGTQFNLADCLEHTGRLKKAKEMFVRVADAAHEKGQSEREQVARDRARALDESLPKIGIEVKEVAEGLEVLIDDETVDRTKWASGERVDPGSHEITAKAPKKKTWSLRVEVGAAPSTLTITVPKLEDDAEKPNATEPAEAKLEPKAPRPEAPVRTKPRTVDQTMKVLFLAGAGAGVVLAATGFGLYKMSNDDAKEVCPSSVNCTQEEIQRHEDYLNDAAIGRTIGYLGAGLAGAALIGFTVTAVSTPSTREGVQRATFRAAPLLGGGAYGASFGGRF
jgi:tetratricopeptide (TPR) repeat protein